MMKLLVLLSALMLAGCDVHYKSTSTSGGDFSSTNSVAGDTTDNSDSSNNSDNSEDNSTVDASGNTTGDSSTFTAE